MNLSEFKAWFEGFTENLDGPPGPKAWERICEKVKAITSDPTPWPTFVKEYVPYYPRWQYVPSIWSVGLNWVSNNLQPSSVTMAGDAPAVMSNMSVSVTPLDAFRDIGRLDAQSM